jgi:cytochrome c-type biogenesis protein CcmH
MKLPDLARNMHRFFTATTILLILFWSSLTFGQVFSPDETISRIADNLMCTCGCPHIIGQCGDECSVAPQLVHEISQLLTEGKTEEEVYKIFEDKYGLRVHAAPKAEGFNLLAWVMPFVGLLAGMVVVFIVVNRLKPDESSQEADRVRPEIDEKYRKLIDRELER